MYSLQFRRRLRLKVRVGEGEAVPTVTGIWPTANWHEREVYDLFAGMTADSLNVMTDHHPPLRSYGRLKSRPIKPRSMINLDR